MRKTIIMLILLAMTITACTKTEQKIQVTDDQAVTKIEPANKTIPPGTIVQQSRSQIKFNIIPPPEMNESVHIGN